MAKKQAAPTKSSTPTKATKQTMAVAKRQTTAVANVSDMMSADANDGMQGMGQADMAIPFLRILQGLSPQIKKNNERYVQGAQEGMIINTLNNMLYQSVRVIPCAYVKQVIEWRPRKQGGGFVAAHDLSAPIVQATPRNDEGKRITKDGNELSETASYFVLLVEDDGSVSPAVIAMASTQLKKARQWNSIMKQSLLKRSDGQVFVPPMYAYFYEISTQGESNAKGDFCGWVIEQGELVIETSAELYQQAKAFATAIRAQQVKVDHSQMVDTVTEEVPNDDDDDNGSPAY